MSTNIRIKAEEAKRLKTEPAAEADAVERPDISVLMPCRNADSEIRKNSQKM